MDPRLKVIPVHCVNGEDFPYPAADTGQVPRKPSRKQPMGGLSYSSVQQTATAETLEGCHWGERRRTLQGLGENTGEKTVQIYHFFIGLEIKGLHQSKGV